MIDRYNEKSGNWDYETYDVETSDIIFINETEGLFILYLDNYDLTGSLSISLESIYALSNDSNNYYIDYIVNYPFISFDLGEDLDYTYPIYFNVSDNASNSQNDENDSTNDSIQNSKSTSSSKLSKGMLIGIIAGILGVIIIATIIIVYFCCCLKKKTDNPGDETNVNINVPTIGEVIKKIKITFQTTSQLKTALIIEDNKSMEELRKLYLKEIDKLSLIDDENIFFLYKGEILSCELNSYVKDYFKDNDEETNIIIVVDNNDTKDLNNKK